MVSDHTGGAHDFRAYVDVPVTGACCVRTGAMWVAVEVVGEVATRDHVRHLPHNHKGNKGDDKR